MVEVGDGRSFVMADLPGLIEFASEGKGLGIQFLQHVERCKVLIHVIDMGGEDHRDPPAITKSSTMSSLNTILTS